MSKTRTQKKTVSSPPAPVTGRWDWALLFFGALALHAIGIGWGLPTATHQYSYHPDEIFVIQPALGMLQGDWNPHFFNYGTLYLYLVGIASWLAALIGLSPAQSTDLSLLYILGRMVTALMGAGTVALLYIICRPLAGRRFAIIAALILLFTPLHLVNSHFATVDVPSTFFLMLGALACVRIITSGKPVWYIAAGAAMGLATATKYTLAIGILMVIGAYLLRSRQSTRQHAWLLAALIAFPLFFLVGNPYALDGLHLRQEFLSGPNSVGFEMQHMRETRTAAFIATGSGWSYHALRGLPAALGIPLYLLVLVGIGLTVVGRRAPAPAVKTATLFLFAAWSLFFFLMIGAASERFIRYLVPLMPFCAIFAALVVEKVLTCRAESPTPPDDAFRASATGKHSNCATSQRTAESETPPYRGVGGARRPRPTVGTLITGLALLLTLAYSLSQLWLFIQPDPRDRALTAILAQHPATIGIQETPWFRTPPVSPVNAGAPGRTRFEEWLVTAPYKVVVTGWSVTDLEREKPDIFTISDLQYADELRLGNAQTREFTATLPRRYQSHQDFRNPTPLEWLAGGAGRVPPDWLYLKPKVSLYSNWRRE